MVVDSCAFTEMKYILDTSIHLQHLCHNGWMLVTGAQRNAQN